MNPHRHTHPLRQLSLGAAARALAGTKPLPLGEPARIPDFPAIIDSPIIDIGEKDGGGNAFPCFIGDNLPVEITEGDKLRRSANHPGLISLTRLPHPDS